MEPFCQRVHFTGASSKMHALLSNNFRSNTSTQLYIIPQIQQIEENYKQIGTEWKANTKHDLTISKKNHMYLYWLQCILGTLALASLFK